MSHHHDVHVLARSETVTVPGYMEEVALSRGAILDNQICAPQHDGRGGAISRGVILPTEVAAGDVLIGMASSGIHTNGCFQIGVQAC